MNYAIADIHGCFREYKRMLEEIKFKAKDALYVLGDIIDRGDDGIKILQDMVERENVHPIMGNHEFMILDTLRELSWGDYDPELDESTIQNYVFMSNAMEESTLRAFVRLPRAEKKRLVEYVEGFPPYREVTAGGQKYLLVHGGLPDFTPGLPLEHYEVGELVFGPHLYHKKYFDDTIVVTGHISTHSIDDGFKGKIYRNKNNIALDCGMPNGSLGCLCLDTGEEFYIPKN